MNTVVLRALYFVAQKGWVESNVDYFDALVEFLGNTLALEYAMVDALLPSGTAAKTVGLFAKGSIVPNIEYDLAGTPCENVIGKSLCCYPCHIQAVFPNDTLLVDLGVESYVGIPLWDSRGEALGLIAVMGQTALTDERRAIAQAVLQVVALRCAHELESRRDFARLRDYRELLHGSVDGFWLVDHSGVVLETNASYAQMSGYSAQELVGMPVAQLEANDSESQILKRVQRVIANGHDRFETRHRKRDGTLLDVEVSALYWAGDGGRFAVLIRDLSPQKRSAREKIELEHRLQAAQQLEAVGRLAGGVAHDFNNMLGVILGYTSVLLEVEGFPEAAREDVLEIQRAAERSAGLTRQLLSFARQAPAQPKVINLNDTVAELLGVLTGLLGEGVEFAFCPADDLWPIRIDPAQFHQVLTALIANARDATSGKGRVSLSTFNCDGQCTHAHCPGEPSRQFVSLSVTDDGCGMSEATRSHIFEPFYSTKGPGKGSGLGLSTVYGIVTQNGGTIEVTSTPDAGSQFTIHLPRHLGGDRLSPNESASHCKSSNKLTVLVVEDEVAVLRLVTRILTGLGYSTLSAENPQKAIELAHAHAGTLSVLLTDVVMPGMNGKALDAKIRSRFPDIRTLFMSGYTADLIADHGIISEGVQFLSKPFTKQDLVDALGRLGFSASGTS